MKKFPITTRIKCALYAPLLCFHILTYKACKSSAIITSDIVRWGEIRSFVDTKLLCPFAHPSFGYGTYLPKPVLYEGWFC